MLNKDGQRELAYVVTIDGIEPIVGSDNCEAALVGGWRVMVKKETFKPGDLAIYFEIDSKVPEKEEFAFLSKKHYKVKTQKYTFGGKGCMISQGLLMSFEDFGGYADIMENAGWLGTFDGKTFYKQGDFLTEVLGVTYSVEEDNNRKARSADKYKLMAQRHPAMFKKPFFRWMMKRDWGKKVLFIFFGRKKDKKREFPAWVSKTDEERVQNMPWILNDKTPWIATEKIDGTSTTFTVHKKKVGGQYDFYVCSRNVVFDTPEKAEKCFYDSNYYLEMAEKYNVKEVLIDIAKKNNYEWVTLQGETYGEGVQKRDYSLKGREFAGFNFITPDLGRWNSLNAKDMLSEYGIPWVPIISERFILPDTVDELLDIATDKSQVDGKEREGIVFRYVDGTKSFKAVSNEFLLKYHA